MMIINYQLDINNDLFIKKLREINIISNNTNNFY